MSLVMEDDTLRTWYRKQSWKTVIWINTAPYFM